MVTRGRRAPWWVLGIATGVSFAAAMSVFFAVRDIHHWRLAVVTGSLSGVVFQWLVGRRLQRQNQVAQAVMAGLDAQDVQRGARALKSAGVPADPAVRAGAARLARHRLQLLTRPRIRTTFSIVIVAYVLAALVWSPWWWLAVAFFLAMLAVNIRQVRHLRQRLEALGEGPPTTSEW